MHFSILAIGSRGDVQPYVALALGLQRAGHQISLAAFSDFGGLIQEHGLDFFPIPGVNHDLLESKRGQDFMESGDNFIRVMRALADTLESFPPEFWSGLWNACQGADAIIYSSGAPQGYHIAEKLGIPSFAAFHSPYLGRTRFFPHPLWPFELRLGGTYNWLTHLIAEQFMWQPFRPAINQWRRESLKLGPAPFLGPYGKMQRLPVLYGYSPAVFPKPPDWGEQIHVSGFWFLDRPSGWQPPSPLVDFLAAGPPPVYIGFGSMSSHNPQENMDIAVQALTRARQRGVLAVPSGGLDSGHLPDDIFPVASVPHDWLFPRMAAVVHHGGPGTIASSLRAGVPSITVPFTSDQPFWGRQVAASGFGPKPIPRKHLTAERLEAAIQAAISDAAIRSRAAELGKQVREEDGVTRAVESIHGHLSLISA